MKVKISKKEIHALAAVVLAGADNILCKNFEYEDCNNRKFKKCLKELQPLLDRLQKKNVRTTERNDPVHPHGNQNQRHRRPAGRHPPRTD